MTTRWILCMLLCSMLHFIWAVSTVQVSRKEGIATGQVHVLQGSSGALALSYYLTGPGDLHYAIVKHGHAALSAEDIKATANSIDVKKNAGTFVSTSATRLAWNAFDLEANTTYDVYFVAEASNSNGVFGTVISVNGTTTHPQAPLLTLKHSTSHRGSSSTAEFSVNCSSSGLLHYIVVASVLSRNLSAQDIWSSNHSKSAYVPSTQAFHINVTDLIPFTSYDLWMVTEVKRSDGVLGNVLHKPHAFSTHAMAPDVVHAGCIPRGGSTSDVLAGLRLQFPPQAFTRDDTQRVVEYLVYYIADSSTTPEKFTNGAQVSQATNTSTRFVRQIYLSFPSTEVHNIQIVSSTDNSVDLHANITHLPAGTNFSLTFVVETKDSGGIYGNVFGGTSCRTHPPAPKVESVEVRPLLKTTDSAELFVTMQETGNAHYAIATSEVYRKISQNDFTPFASFVEKYDQLFRFGALPDVGPRNASIELIAGLNASTTYAVLVYPETQNSFGVYGSPFSVREFKTNDPASQVNAIEAIPVLGSTTRVQVKVSLEKPHHYIFVCWRESAPVEPTCTNFTGQTILSNLTTDQSYEVYAYAETSQGVSGVSSNPIIVVTHTVPPNGITLDIRRIDGYAEKLVAKIHAHAPAWVHYALINASAINDVRNISKESILSRPDWIHRYETIHINHTWTGTLKELAPNTTYIFAAFLESTSVNGTHSQVYGDLVSTNITTFASAPTIVQSSVYPLNGTTDQFFLVANLSCPGRMHYMITDTDLHDPNVLKSVHHAPFVRRGYFDVYYQLWDKENQTINGVNVTVDVALPIFNNNHTIHGLETDKMYHVFVTTETFDSNGVFGALVAPHLATTHAYAPEFKTLTVEPTPGKATSLSFNFTLSRYGLVHYIVMLRDAAGNFTNETFISDVNSSTLIPSLVKDATIENLGLGVVYNGSVPLSREDWAKIDSKSHKEFTGLIPGATYEVCVVAETDASNGEFGDLVCTIQKTFIDYSNASLTWDTFEVTPVDGTTDQVKLAWNIKSNALIKPYFALLQGSHHSTNILSSFSRTPFSELQPGQHSILAAGALPHVHDSVYSIIIKDLEPNSPFGCFFTGETIGSHGVFTKINESHSVMTHAPPPVLTGYFARPATGNTTGLEVVLDINCAKSVSCHAAIVHLVVTYPSSPPPVPFNAADHRVLVYSRHNVSLQSSSSAKQHVLYVEDASKLTPMTDYSIHVVTETPNSNGVYSTVKSMTVQTYPNPPDFTYLHVGPRDASTTELILEYELSTPGHVHFLIGEDSKHIEVVSPYNISGKKLNNQDLHRYPPTTIQYRKTLTITSTTRRTEVLGYLSGNTNYTVWVVAETSADGHLYGAIQTFANISTHAPAPLLISHEASPTPGSTTHLRLSYKLSTNDGLLHCVVAAFSPWTSTLDRPITFGNRIGYDTTIVAQATLQGGVPVDIPVPFPDYNYTIYMITETSQSQGVFGAVAQLDNIKTSADAPDVLEGIVTATDARTDALTVQIRLNRVGVVHYSITKRDRPLELSQPPPFHIANDTNVTLIIDGLNESTYYDIYIQTETTGSGGVVGKLLKFTSAMPTHGPPPVMLEEVDCTRAPNCEALGREPCWLKANTCGECREGYSGDEGPSNVSCTKGTKKKGKKTIGIKINGVKQPTPIIETEVQANQFESCPENAKFSLSSNRCECADGFAQHNNACIRICPVNSSPTSPGHCQCDPGFTLDNAGVACVLHSPHLPCMVTLKRMSTEEDDKNRRWMPTIKIKFSRAKLLYRIDTFISTKQGQTVMLVGFGVFLVIFCALFFSLVPSGEKARTAADMASYVAAARAALNQPLSTIPPTTIEPTTSEPSDSSSNVQDIVVESLWNCWLFIADPGAQLDQTDWNKRTFAFFVSLIGMVYFFVIMGFVVDSIRAKMEDLKKGKSNVVEKNHSLILGWSDKSVALIKQLCLANESEGGGVVVILAEMEKEEIEAEIQSQLEYSEFKGTKVVVRSGSPLVIPDLKKVSAHAARSITILATSIDADKSDAACLRIILSLRGLFKLQGHVVAEIRDIDNEPLVHLVGGNIVETLVSHDIIGRLILQSARSPGLSRVYNSVLGFDGDEFYSQAWPELIGVTFHQLIPRFPAAAPIGIKKSNGKVVIKPSMEYKIQEGDEIIVLAEDNDTYKPESPALIPPVPIPTIIPKEKIIEKILICGWRRDIQDMLVLLDNFVPRGSEVHLLNELSVKERETFLSMSGVDADSFDNCIFHHHIGNTSVRRYLEPLELETYTSIMVLCDFQRELDILNSDSHSLATVLLLRNLQKGRKDMLKESLFGPRICQAIDRWTRHAANKCPCITEVLDPRTQKTVVANASISGHSDFVMSNELISCMLAMISESRSVKHILSRLLAPKSNTFTVQSSSRYCNANESLSYFQLAHRLIQADELLVGYISKRDKTAPAVLNPKDKSTMKKWKHYDLIIITGGSKMEEKATELKRAVVDTIEEAVRKRHGSLNRHNSQHNFGVSASNPPEIQAMTRRAPTGRRLTMGLTPPTFDNEFELTPETRQKLTLLYEEWSTTMADVKVLPTLTAQKYAVENPPLSRGTSIDLVTKSSLIEKTKPKRSFSYGALIAYKIDTFISTRKGQTITLVSFGSVFTILMGGIIYSIHDETDSLFKEALWDSWMYMTFPGAQRDAIGWTKRTIAMFVSIIGILFFAVILGFVVDSVREKMDSLKKGKSQVVEENHTLLLGWTDKSIYLIRELCRANESEKGGVVVVLAELDKEYLEAELRSQMREEDLLGSKIVFRTGNPLLIVDLLKVSAHTARSIVIMATLGDADKSDASVLRIILSLLGLPKLRGHIVAEVRDIDNEPLIALVGGGIVETLVSHDVIGRLVIMSARSPGLAKVFSSVLGFEGNEFYISEWPTCIGKPFGELPERFQNAVPIGIELTDGDIEIKPPSNRLMELGEKIVFLAEDNDTYKAEEIPIEIIPTPIHPLIEPQRHIEKVLMCGWRRDIRDMIQLLDDLVLKGSEVHLLCEDPPIDERDKQLVESGLDLNTLENIDLVHQFGNSAIRRHVDQLPLEDYTSVMVLGDQSRETDILHSDSHSLSSVLLLRGLQAARKKKAKKKYFSEKISNSIINWIGEKNENGMKCPCITEILDPRTQKTISSNKTISSHSEFIQSNELVSCMLAMISESRKVKKILNELLGAAGCSFSVESSARYCKTDEQLSFYQVAKRAIIHDEILCGYQTRIATDSTILNPPDKNIPRVWNEIDFVLIQNRHDKKRDKNLMDHGTQAFQDAARQRHVSTILEKSQIEESSSDLSKKLQETMDVADNRVVQVTREVLERLSLKLSLILKECEQNVVA